MKLAGSLRHTAQKLIPSGRFQWLFFLLTLFSYLALAYSVAYPYSIVFDPRIPWDAYLSFDNRAVVLTGGGYERHPLSVHFFQAVRELALFLSEGKFDAVFRVVLSFSSTLAVALSVLYVLKYALDILELDRLSASIVSLFFAGFSTVLFLSFTPETYTYSMLFLVGYVYLVALAMRQGKGPSFLLLSISSVLIAGMTITNIVKVFIPVLFTKDFFRSWKRFFSSVLYALLAAGIFVLLYLYRLNFDIQRVLDKSLQQYEKFSQPKSIHISDMVFSWFYGGNILLPQFELRDYHNGKGFEFKALFLDLYDGFGAYVALGILLAFVLWSVVVNFREKMVGILGLMLLVDVVIHCGLQFGLHTSYIYGGHFVFVYPLLLGYLLKRYKIKKEFYPKLLLGMAFLVFYFWTNNVFRLGEFFSFLELYYKE